MVFLGILYIGMLTGLAYYTNKLSKYLEEEREPIEETLSLNRNIDTNNIVFKSVNDNCIRINQGVEIENKQVLVCCTGDNNSMALLTCVANIFGSDNTNVLLINHHKNNTVKMFVHDVCDYNGFKFFNYDYNNLCFNNSDNLKKFRYTKINEICKKQDIAYVFEGHTIENYSNSILHNFFTGKTFNNNTNINTLKPFLNLTNIIIEDFIYNYNVPVDEHMTHLEFNNFKVKDFFNEIDKTFTILYPDWRYNLVRAYNATNNIINENSSNINVIINSQCNLGDFGFIYYHDLSKTSYGVYKIILDTICDEYNMEHFSNSTIENMYNDNETYTYKFTDELSVKCNEFINKLTKDNNVNPHLFMATLINSLLNSDNMDEFETDTEDTYEESDEESEADEEAEGEADEEAEGEADEEAEGEADEEAEGEAENEAEAEVDQETSEESDEEADEDINDIEYPLMSVDLTNEYIYKIINNKLVSEIDFNRQLIDGILYFTVINGKFKFFY